MHDDSTDVSCNKSHHDSKDTQIATLSAQLGEQRRKHKMLESELQLTLASMRNAEEAHTAELIKSEGNSLKTSQETRALMGRLQGIHDIEDALRTLYVQLRDRCCHYSRLASGVYHKLQFWLVWMFKP
jgi:hypothetical protein